MRILIDLSILKNIHCGLGQVALNYGYFFRDEYEPVSGEEIYLLVPKLYVGAFGDKVHYIAARKIYRIMPWLIGKRFDVWHAIHQLSRYKPFAAHYILTIHDFNFVYEKQGSKVDDYLRKIQAKADRADAITAISEFARQETRHYLHTDKPISVIYNGIERIECQPQQMPANIKQPYLFSIGELKPKKNFHVLIDIMRHLPEYELYIAGNDSTPYAQEMESMIRTNNVRNVHLIGKVSAAEKNWLYQHCRAFLFPSLFEGFGLPIVEAMLFCKPVVCSHETSLIEIGNKHVTFFEKGYPAASSAALIRSAIEKSTTQELEAAYSYATSYSWSNHMKAYLSLYRSLGSGGSQK